MIYLIIVAAIVAVMSLITFILYGADKRKAKKGKWRISEKVLLLFPVFGGAIGGLLGMLVFRHKTKHWYFVVVNVLFTFIYVALLAFLAYKAM